MSLPTPEALGVDTSLPVNPDLGGAVGGPEIADLGAPSFGAAPPVFPDSGPGDGNLAGMGAGSGAPIGGGRGRVVEYAKRFLGDPYVWGGTRPGGFDCSGLIQYVMKQAAGVDLPRISYQQANYGKRTDIGSLRPGDLVAWDNSSRNAGADHIAIYAGNGYIIEAAKPGTPVRMRKLGKNEGAWGVALEYGVHSDARSRAV